MRSYPRLRWPLDVQRTVVHSQDVLLLCDRSGVAPEVIFLPTVFGPLLARLDGRHSLEELCRAGTPFGLQQTDVERLVNDLERFLFLEGEQARARAEAIRSEFLHSPWREAAFAGRIYPNDQEDLLSRIDEFRRDAGADPFQIAADRSVAALIAPHIDYTRGWRTYCSSQSILNSIVRPDVIFLLGTAHEASRGLFHLTRKSYRGPFGEFSTCVQAVDEVARTVGSHCFAEEILHRNEHSLELQLPFLASRYAGDRLPEIVPILVGSFYPLLRSGQTGDGELADFIGAMGEAVQALQRAGQRVLLYGGVDLAHMGLAFDDQERLTPDDRMEIERRDREFLQFACGGDVERVFAHVAEDLDRRRLCGFPSIYTMLAVLRAIGVGCKGQIVEYRQAYDGNTDCLVSFASACWMTAGKGSEWCAAVTS